MVLPVVHFSTWARRTSAAHNLNSSCPKTTTLLQINWLIVPGSVELCTPHLVHALVLRATEANGCSEPDVQIAHAFETRHHSFSIELRPIALQGSDQNVGVYEALERDVIWRYPGSILGERGLVVENQGRVAIERRHDLSHDHPRGISFAQEHQLIRQGGAAHE